MGNFLSRGLNRDKSGFTMIEMLIVVSVILILSSIGLFTYSGYLKRSRDDRRQSDLEKIRSAIEIYRSSQVDHVYPDGTIGTIKPLLEAGYIDDFPKDPNATGLYFYRKINDNYYELCAHLETGGTEPCTTNAGGTAYCDTAGTKQCNYRVVSP